MADLKLSELPEEYFLNNSAEFYINQSALSEKVSRNRLRLNKYRWAAQAYGATTPTLFGLVATSFSTGTAGAVLPVATPTYRHEFYDKIGYLTTGAVNINCGLVVNRSTGQKRGHDSLTNVGGFHWWARFTPLISSASAARCIFGAYSSSTFPTTNLEPADHSAVIFAVAKDSTDTNLQFLCKGPGLDVSKTDLGITLASLENNLLDLEILALRNGSMYIQLTNLDTGTVYSHSLADGSIYLPSRSTSLYLHLFQNTGTQTVAQRIGFISAEGITLD
jgi:hypothetical protein